MKAKVDLELCIGCSLCVGTCPEVFRMEEDKAIVYVEEVPVKVYASCRQAAQECPVEAIRVEE